MKINVDNPAEEVRIEIVPLIDVIFCILTFFLLAALQLTRQQAISVDLPKVATGTPQMREMLMVSLDDFGQIYVEQQVMPSQEQLVQSLKNYRATNPNGLIVLYASRTASYNDVMQVLDLLRESGGDRVSLATLQGPSPGNNTNPNPTLPPGANIPGIAPYTGTTPNPTIPTNPQFPAPTNPNLGLPTQPGIQPGLPGGTQPGTLTPGATQPGSPPSGVPAAPGTNPGNPAP